MSNGNWGGLNDIAKGIWIRVAEDAMLRPIQIVVAPDNLLL